MLVCNGMRDMHSPRKHHGLQVLYEYAVDAGQMERSRFFGWSTDLYHFDHFMGKAAHEFKDMVGMKGHTVTGTEELADGRVVVAVEVEVSAPQHAGGAAGGAAGGLTEPARRTGRAGGRRSCSS